MDSNQTVEEKIVLLHQKAKTLLHNKTEEDLIISELTKEGIEASYAQMIIENIKDEIADKKNFWKELAVGFLVTIGGLLLNYFSYFISGNSGTFIIFWGIVVFGISIIIRAFILFKLYQYRPTLHLRCE